VRLRHGAPSIPGQAAPDPQLRLGEARLYVITPDAAPERILAIARAAARGGADIVQLRHKSLARGELLTLAREMRESVGDGLFIVNDHVDIAMLSGADGVHLGPDDISVAAARRVAGDQLLIGASASTVDAARRAVEDGADYIGCGPAFATPVKSEKKVIGPQGVAAVAQALPSVPVFAIGGIDEKNLSQLIAVGLRRACVIRAVSDAPDFEEAARRLRGMLAT
jgi:thiamine-phosphate pyrophosphorylase